MDSNKINNATANTTTIDTEQMTRLLCFIYAEEWILDEMDMIDGIAERSGNRTLSEGLPPETVEGICEEYAKAKVAGGCMKAFHLKQYGAFLDYLSSRFGLVSEMAEKVLCLDGPETAASFYKVLSSAYKHIADGGERARSYAQYARYHDGGTAGFWREAWAILGRVLVCYKMIQVMFSEKML